MTTKENTTLEKLLAAAVDDANTYFDDWDRGHREGNEFVKTTAYGQIDAILRVIRRINSDVFEKLQKERGARVAAARSADKNATAND